MAASIKQGTVTASLMMKKSASYPKQNGLAKVLREIGRIEQTLFMLDWFRDPGLQRRVHYVWENSCFSLNLGRSDGFLLVSTKSVTNLMTRLFMYCACGTHEKTGRLCVGTTLT